MTDNEKSDFDIIEEGIQTMIKAIQIFKIEPTLRGAIKASVHMERFREIRDVLRKREDEQASIMPPSTPVQTLRLLYAIKELTDVETNIRTELDRQPHKPN